MTGDAQKFSHISVASDDEDDVVIEAGAPRSRSYGEGESVSQPARDEAPAHAAATEATAADGGEGLADRASSGVASAERASTPAPERAAKADKPAKASAPARKGYEETTLEDLESTKMSGMQKGIIAVALIGIAAFIVYYVAFMG